MQQFKRMTSIAGKFTYIADANIRDLSGWGNGQK